MPSFFYLLLVEPGVWLSLKARKRKASGRLDRMLFWRRHPDLNRGVRVLQTLALPLGDGAAGEGGDTIPMRLRRELCGEGTVKEKAVDSTA